MSHVGFVVDEVALGQVLYEYIGFFCQSFHRLLHTPHNPSSGAGTIGPMVEDVPRGPRFTPSQESKKLSKPLAETNNIYNDGVSKMVTKW
jgi:hypothetical protein